MTLTEFLLARIAEDDEKARNAAALASVYAPKKLRWHWLRTDGSSSAWEPTNHTPERVLAECEAKRRIVESAQWAMAPHRGTNGLGPSVLMNLAAVYADHPDYDEAWQV